MLVISRKTGERIVIGENVEVVVVRVQGDRVKLGFLAPQGVTIYREEIYERVRKEKGSIHENPVLRSRQDPAAVA